MKPLTLVLTTLAFLFSLASCSSLQEPVERSRNWSVEKLYEAAKDALEIGDYQNAIRFYEILQSRFPSGRFAEQSKLDLIYAYYKFEEPASALLAADRFIQEYPRHSHIDYVYYLKGLVNFEKNLSLATRFLPLDRSQRDIYTARQSFESFATLVRRYPDSRYAEDARQRMIFLRNILARSQLHIAEFYLKRGAYLAAANRARTVVEKYQGVDVMPKALMILAKSYKILELNDLYETTLRLLRLNYPDYPALKTVENLVVR